MSQLLYTYKSVSDLKKQVLANYVKELEAEKRMKQSILDDPNWASDGSAYHKECRKTMRQEILLATRIVRLLTK